MGKVEDEVDCRGRRIVTKDDDDDKEEEKAAEPFA